MEFIINLLFFAFILLVAVWIIALIWTCFADKKSHDTFLSKTLNGYSYYSYPGKLTIKDSLSVYRFKSQSEFNRYINSTNTINMEGSKVYEYKKLIKINEHDVYLNIGDETATIIVELGNVFDLFPKLKSNESEYYTKDNIDIFLRRTMPTGAPIYKWDSDTNMLYYVVMLQSSTKEDLSQFVSERLKHAINSKTRLLNSYEDYVAANQHLVPWEFKK